MNEGNVEAAGNGGTLSNNVTCPFYAVSETIPEEDWQVTCIPFDAEGCLDYSPPTIVTPSPSPMASLTPAPTKDSYTKPHPKGMNMHMKPPKGKGRYKGSKSITSKSKASKSKSANSSQRN